MKRVQFLSLVFLFITGIWIACKRNDAEPDYPISPISRLYVSFSDLANADTGPLQNIVVFDPSDSTNYFPNSEGLNSTPKTGMGIFFSPILSQGFQVSHDDTTIKYFTVNDVGALSASSRFFKDTVQLHSPRAIEYDRYSDLLFITNDASADTVSPSLNIYYNPMRLAGQQYARKRLTFDELPWDLANNMIIGNDSIMLVSMRGGTNQIWAFKMHDITAGDQSNRKNPDYKLTIEGANDLRGIAYSDSLDILAIADLGPGKLNDNPANRSIDGKIYLIEKAREVIAAGGSITPSRIITGPTTTLVDPIDVAIAGSPNRNQFIYVADRNKRILRFTIDATGDVSPEMNKSTGKMTPEFLYLDARN